MSRRPPRGAPVHGVGTVHLLRRQVLTDRAAVLTVALIVLVTSALAAAVPRVLDTLQTDGVRATVDGTGSLQRDLAAVVFAAPPLAEGEQPLEPTRALLGDTLAAMPPLVRERVGTPAFAVDFRDLTVGAVTPEVESRSDNEFLELSVQSDVDDQVEYVDGRAPESIEVVERDDALPADPGRVLPRAVTHRGVLEVAVSDRTAADMGMQVGSEVRITELDLTLRVVGVFRAVADGDPYWGFDTRVLTPQQNYSSLLGVYFTGVALFAEQAYPELEALMAGVRSPVTLLRFPTTGEGLQAADVPDLLSAVRAVEGTTFTSEPSPAREQAPVAQLATFGLSTDLDEVIGAHLRQQAASTAVVSLVVSGLLGVSVAVLALAGRLVVERRQRSLALAVARGASPAQLRVLMLLEGLVLGLPAALAGWALAAWLVPGQPGTWGVVLPLLLGVAPAVLLPVLARPGGLRAVRRDVGPGRARYVRTALEVLAVLAAVGALALLRRRGLDAGAAEAGVDPLLAAAPLLLALAGALLLARLYPLPVAALTRRLSRRPGAVSFLGAARAGRDAPAGTLPLVVLLLALSTAVFGAVVAATTDRGSELAAVAAVGADARISGLGLDDDALAAAAGVDGVRAVAGSVETPVAVRTDRSTTEVTLIAADTEALAAVQRGLPGAPEYPAGLWSPGQQRVPVLVRSGLASVGDELVLGEGSSAVDAVVVATAPGAPPPVRTTRPWAVVDRQLLLDAGGDVPLPTTALLDLEGDPDAAETERLESELRSAMGTVSPLLTRAGAVERSRGAPLVAGTLQAFPVAAVVAAALSALAVILTLVVTAPARSRLLSRLRTLGLSPRQAQGLAVWEVAPLAVTALAAGLLLGLAVPWLVAPAVDLRAFTGGASAPPYTVAAGSVAAIAAGFVAVISAAVAVTVASNRRLRLGAVLRVGEEQ